MVRYAGKCHLSLRFSTFSSAASYSGSTTKRTYKHLSFFENARLSISVGERIEFTVKIKFLMKGVLG